MPKACYWLLQTLSSNERIRWGRGWIKGGGGRIATYTPGKGYIAIYLTDTLNNLNKSKSVILHDVYWFVVASHCVCCVWGFVHCNFVIYQ